MPARLGALNHERIDARAHQLLREGQRRGKTDQLRARSLHRRDRRAGGNAAGQRDVPDLFLGADLDKVEERRVHGDQVNAEGLVVSARVATISSRSRAGSIAPHAIMPKPPAFEMADTRFRSETQVIAPAIIA